MIKPSLSYLRSKRLRFFETPCIYIYRGRVGDRDRDREKEREGERKMEDCETFTNYKIACCVRCLFCLRLVLFSVCLSGVCYSTKEIEIEIEKEREGERERES